MKSVIPAIAASFLTIFALTPSLPLATAYAASDHAPVAHLFDSFEPATASMRPGHVVLAQQEMPDADQNQNDSSDASNPNDSADSSAGDDNSGSDDQNNGDDAQQNNGDDAQNGDADNNADADQNSGSGENGDSDAPDNGDSGDQPEPSSSSFSPAVSPLSAPMR